MESMKPWFTPVLETALGRELPGELESLLFCVQTGIGVGVIAFFMGRFVERRKWMMKTEKKMILIDKLSYHSKLRYVNASEKLMYAVLTLVLCILSRSVRVAVLVFCC